MSTESLTYENERGESIVFAPASVFHVNMDDVSGLSDIRSENFHISSMGQDGATFLGSRIESRDIEIVGHINSRGKEETHRLRRRMNSILNPQHRARLIYQLGNFQRVIDCNIVNAPIFIRGEILERFTIQLVCLNPFWREMHETRRDIGEWMGAMEFPYREPDDLPHGLEIPEDGWEIGWREPSVFVVITNRGNVRAGMRVEFRAMGKVVTPHLFDVNTRDFMQFNLELRAGDVLTVSTGFGQKGVTLRRDGETTDAFRFLDPDSRYLQLAVGDNVFRYGADFGDGNLEVSIIHTNLFLGV